MTTTVIGAIEGAKTAHALVNELVQAGFKRQDVEVLEGAEKELLAKIVERGFDEDDARGYAEAVRGGKTLVAARAPDGKIEQAVAIIERHEAAGGASATKAEGETIQEIEEELSVGKRKVATGGVRVTSSVSETPAEQTVTLRDERVETERKPANRVLSAKEAATAFEGKTVEVLATSEEAKVTKEARVVGEVAVGKQVDERQETVKDTVRRTRVEVEEVGGKARKPS